MTQTETPTLLVTLSVNADRRALIEEELPPGVDCVYLDDVDPSERERVVADADVLISGKPHEELGDAFDTLHDGQVVQAVSAGVDHYPLDRFPEGVVLQNNAGAHAEPIAEHVLALYFALAKRLRVEHEKLRDGEFDQFEPNRMVAGSTCTIFGFGGIGREVAWKLGDVGVSIRAINRSGETSEDVEFVGTPDDLHDALDGSDALVVAAPLTEETRGFITRETLDCLPDDGLFVNIARGELVDQGDLYRHLEANPAFQAGIEAWWTEPIRHGEFTIEYPFFDLPNVIGSPHNAAQVKGLGGLAFRRAVRTALVPLTTEENENVVDRDLGY